MFIVTTLVRISLQSSWPEGGSRLVLERKDPGHRTYEVVSMIESERHIDASAAEQFIVELSDLVVGLLASAGFGAQYLPAFDVDPY